MPVHFYNGTLRIINLSIPSVFRFGIYSVMNSPLLLQLDTLSPPLPVASSCWVGVHFKIPPIFRRLSAT